MSLALGLKNLQEDISENLEELGELEKSIREAFRDSVAMWWKSSPKSVFYVVVAASLAAQ